MHTTEESTTQVSESSNVNEPTREAKQLKAYEIIMQRAAEYASSGERCERCGAALLPDIESAKVFWEHYFSGEIVGIHVYCPKCRERAERERVKREREKAKYLAKIGNSGMTVQKKRLILHYLSVANRDLRWETSVYGPDIEPYEELGELIKNLQAIWNDTE